ncbi:MAG: DegQ family serine endoprotease [Acidobacteria bacterium]|nr:DegQ family serine endoprotease [Acidobacteriota bacterium]MBI3282298.1 DegQ family serine endoprotease [Acidobacteriota bacterium]
MRTTIGTGFVAAVVFAATVLASASCRRERPPEKLFEKAAPAHPGDVTSYAEVVDRVAPAVVTVRSERRVRAPRPFPFFDDPLFREFFGFRGTPRTEPPLRQQGLGSGVIVNDEGYILTNHHVIDGAENIKIELVDRRSFKARLIGSDPPSDLAVLKIDSRNLKPLALGDSDRVRVGDVVLAVGNPLGIGQTVTAGIISAKGRATGLSDGSFEDFLQTDAPINRGNSGGALVNTRGELIGINSQIVSPTGGNIGIGFAIPSNMARRVSEQLLRGGKVRRGQLGITIQQVTSDIAASLGMKEVRGILVSDVLPGSPAERAGLKRGDVVLAVNGEKVEDTNSFRNRISSAGPGARVRITVRRGDREQEIQVTLGEFTPRGPRPAEGEQPENGTGGRLGIQVEPLTPGLARQLGVRRGVQGVVVAEVDPAGPAADAGIRRGDVLAEVNREPVRSASDVAKALERSGARPALILIHRGAQSQYLTVQP